MRKLAAAAFVAVALLAAGGASIGEAKAQDASGACATLCTESPARAVPIVITAAFYAKLASIAVDDWNAGGKNRRLADMVVTPGAGYRTDMAARLDHSPALVAVLKQPAAFEAVSVAHNPQREAFLAQWASIQGHEAARLYAKASH